MRIYVLYQTDIWKTRLSRVLFGVFSSESNARMASEKNNLTAYSSDVLIVECELDEFYEY